MAKLLKLLHPKFLLELEDNARAQARFHLFLTWVWIIAMVAIPFLDTFRGAQNLGALLIMEVSLWANFATHFGALSAAQASMKGDRTTFLDV